MKESLQPQQFFATGWLLWQIRPLQGWILPSIRTRKIQMATKSGWISFCAIGTGTAYVSISWKFLRSPIEAGVSARIISFVPLPLIRSILWRRNAWLPFPSAKAQRLWSDKPAKVWMPSVKPDTTRSLKCSDWLHCFQNMKSWCKWKVLGLLLGRLLWPRLAMSGDSRTRKPSLLLPELTHHHSSPVLLNPNHAMFPNEDHRIWDGQYSLSLILSWRSQTQRMPFSALWEKCSEGKHYYVYTVAGSAKLLRIYYARVNEYLRSQVAAVVYEWHLTDCYYGEFQLTGCAVGLLKLLDAHCTRQPFFFRFRYWHKLAGLQRLQMRKFLCRKITAHCKMKMSI